MWRQLQRQDWPNRVVRREWVRDRTLASCVLSTRNLWRSRAMRHESWLPRQRAAWRHGNVR